MLRQRLAEKAAARAPSRAERVEGSRVSPADAARQLAAASTGADRRKLKRMLIEQLLVRRFGAALSNDPSFQRIVEEVTGLLSEDPATSRILDEIAVELHG